jgi:Protein of unknown function (DUF2934)
VNISQQSIEELAYELWHARGCPHGSPQIDWNAAELRLSSKIATTLEAKIDATEIDSFPASDPPATHGADHPPSNAAAKWKAVGIDRDSAVRGRGRSGTSGH